MLFSYADQDELRRVFPNYGGYLSRTQVIDWTQGAGNIWYAYPGITPAMVFFDGVEGVDASSPAAEAEYHYTTAQDLLTIFTASDPNDTMIIEIGEDKDTSVNTQLSNASMELSGMLDARFPRPLPKTTDSTGTTPQYDYIIIRLTCLLAKRNMLLAAADYEQASLVYDSITNADRTGIIDRINDGEYKLNFEITGVENGLIEVVKTGTMEPVQVYGEWTGSLYDRLKLVISTGGAYGTAILKVAYSDGSALYGATLEGITITGGLDSIGQGLYVRFYGTTAVMNDEWQIEVNGTPKTNKSISNMELCRI